MPIVAKNSAEYLFKRQQLLKDYADYAKMREIYKKSSDSIKETGTPFFQSMVEPKTTLETYLDKSKVDENLLNLLTKELGANSGQAKQFIQGLDGSMKMNLLERFSVFEKVFKKNFVTPKLNSLIGAFELFIKEGLYDKKVKVPSKQGVMDWLDTLAPLNLQTIGIIMLNTMGLTIPSIPLVNKERISGLIEKYVKNFKSDLIGYSAFYNLMESRGVGLRGLPKPTTTAESSDTPSNLIQTPITRLVSEPSADATPIIYDPDSVRPILESYDKPTLQFVLSNYQSAYNNLSSSQKRGRIKVGLTFLNKPKPTLVQKLIELKYNPETDSFLSLPASTVAEEMKEEGGAEETKGDTDDELDLPPSVPSSAPSFSGSGYGGIVYMR
tara:strand:- start:2798 stop:3946 length:1149 start_codon:yes stop_codon:yes gene_type:complete